MTPSTSTSGSEYQVIQRLLKDSRAHWKIAWPLCLGHVGQQIMSMVDSAIVGHYSPIALAGQGIAAVLLSAIIFFGVGILLGLDSVIPQAIGKGDPAQARTLYRSGLKIAISMGIPLTVICLAAHWLLAIFGVEKSIAEESATYIYGRLPSVLPYLIYAVNCSYLQAIGLTRPIVVAVIIGNIINLSADILLVFGDGALTATGLPEIGLPALGSLGAAISTSIVTIAMTAYLSFAVFRHKCPNASGASKELIAKISRLGLPIGLQLFAEIGIFAIISMLAGRLGAIPGAAHQVALTLASLTFSIAVGMGAATSVRVGNAVGAGRHLDARRAGFVGTFWGAVFMLFAGSLFIFMPRQLAGLFSNDAEVISVSIPILTVAAVFQLSDAIQAVLTGALRGAGSTRAALAGNLAGHYGVGIWVALWLCFGAGMGVVGLWWGLSAGLTVTAAGLTVYFWRLSSKEIACS